MKLLCEGDVVRALSGPEKGCLGKVLGRRYENNEFVVKWSKPKNGKTTSTFALSELEQVQASEIREPLPEISRILAETVAPYVITCGRMVCLPQRDGTILTCVPDAQTNLKEAFKIIKGSYGPVDGLKMILNASFVTRRPHLVENGMSRKIDEMIRSSSDPAVIVKNLLG